MAKRAQLSIIIPVINEEKNLAKLLPKVCTPEIEVIVVDGGSTDQTVTIAKSYGAQVLNRQAGRGHQLNQGAKKAQSKHLLFLHGDTILPHGFQQEIKNCLGDPLVAVGAFRLQLSTKTWPLQLIAWGANIRSKFGKLPYGDQGFFMTAETFKKIGGFPEVQLMEDFIFIRQARKYGKIALLDSMVKSSSRRWQQQGLVKTTLVNQLIILGFLLGLSPKFLAKLYGVRNNS